MNNRLLNVSEVAVLLGIAEATVYAWTSAKKIPYFRIGGRVRFEEQTIREWLNERRVEPITGGRR